MMINLKERPELFQKTLDLIEKCFQYKDEHSFAVDFAPLMDPSNWHHCFILLSEDQSEVIAHIGLKERELQLSGTEYPVLLIGGICVDENYRGKGIFKNFFEEILKSLKKDYMAHFLWSDQEELYSKFHFYQVGGQVQLGNSSEYNLEEHGYKRTEWSELSPKEFLEITELYDHSIKNCISLKRNLNDWDLIKKIKSTHLYIRKNEKEVLSYLFLGKGQDLQGIIHEFVHKANCGESTIKALANHKLWLPEGIAKTDENSQTFYTAFMKIAHLPQFQDFLEDWSNGDLKLISYNDEKSVFQYRDEEYETESVEFLRYVFGPSPLIEFGSYFRPLFISGLDSI